MSTITISNLEQDRALDRDAMCAVRGGSGNSWLAGLGPLANVNVDVRQNVTQLQKVDVNTLNNVGVIGSGFSLPHLNVSPLQVAGIATAF